MGVCCTKDARPTGTSSSRHFVSVCSSPGRFPAENEYRQESAVENAAEKASIKNDDHPLCGEHRETPKHQHQRNRECLENASQQRNRLTGSAKKRSDQSLAENDGGDSKVVATKPRCAGAITRLKKKDSTRRPKYKDEIMLSENIDLIVEKEIPEIPDEVVALASDVDSFLSDDTPAVESRAASTTSSEVTPRPSARRRKKKKKHDKPVKAKDTEEGDSASSPFAISSVSIPTLKKKLSQETMDDEDIRVEEEIRSMLKDDPFNGEPSAPTPNDADEAPDARTEDATKQRTDLNTSEQEVAEVDLSPSTTSSPSQMHSDSLASLDTEDATKKQTHMMTSEQEVEEVDLSPATTSSLSQMHSDSLTSLADTKQYRERYPTTEKVITDDEKLALDIKYILNDDVDTNESSPQSSSGAVSPKKKPQRPKESFTKEQKSKEGEELRKNVGVASAELKITSGKVSPTKMARRPKKLFRKEQKNTTEKELANDTYYIFSDNFGTAETNRKITSGTVSPIKKKQRPSKYPMGAKQNAVGEELAKDIDFSNAEISSGVVSPVKNTQRLMKYSSIQNNKKAEDEKLANAINYILSDDVATHEASDVTVSPRKKTLPPTTYNKETPKTIDEELANGIRFILNDDVALADESNTDTSSRAVSPTKNTHRPKKCSMKENQNAEHEKLAKDDDDVARKEEISSGAVSSAKKPQCPRKKCSTRKAEHIDDKKHPTDIINHALKDDRPAVKSISKSQISSGKASPRKKVSFQELDDNLAKEITDIIEGDVADVVPNTKNLSSLCTLPPPKKDLTRKHSKQADDQLAKDIAEILSDDIFAVEPDIPTSSNPSEIPRPKTSNPKLLLAMDMDRLFAPDSIVSSDQADDQLEEDMQYILNDDLVDVASNVPIPLRSASSQRVKKQSVTETSKETGDKLYKYQQTLQDKTVQFTSKERNSLGPREASRPRKRIPTRNSRNMADQTTIKASNSSPSQSSLPKSDFSPRSGSTQHPRTDSSRIIENVKDKALSKGTDYIVEEESTAESVRSISCTSSSLQRPKSRNPKRAFAMNTSETQSSSPVASSSRAVQRPKQDYNRKPRHSTCKLAKDASVGGTSRGKPLSSSSAVQRTNKDSTKKSEDMLILEELDTNMEIASSSCVVPQLSKDSIRRQTRATKHSSNQPEKTENADLDNIINAILDIPKADCGASVNATSSSTRQSVSKGNGISVKDVQTPRMQADRQTAVPKQGSLTTHRKAPAHVSSGYSPSTSPGIFYETGELTLMEQIEKESAQAVDDTGVPDIESPNSRSSSFSITTTNFDSGCSVVSGDTMRPMAAGSSRTVSLGCCASSGTVQLPTSDTTRNQLSKRRQTLPAILKEDKTVRKPRLRASRETAVPLLANQQSMTTHRTTAVPVTSGSKPRAAPGIVYESAELKLMEKIERESRRQ
ncbi:uncharacterized protein LOC144629750 [Oculina patagonica]